MDDYHSLPFFSASFSVSPIVDLTTPLISSCLRCFVCIPSFICSSPRLILNVLELHGFQNQFMHAFPRSRFPYSVLLLFAIFVRRVASKVQSFSWIGLGTSFKISFVLLLFFLDLEFMNTFLIAPDYVYTPRINCNEFGNSKRYFRVNASISPELVVVTILVLQQIRWSTTALGQYPVPKEGSAAAISPVRGFHAGRELHPQQNFCSCGKFIP